MDKTSTNPGAGHFNIPPRYNFSIQGWLRFPWDLIQEEYDNNGGYSAFGTLYLEFTDNEWGTNKVHFYHGGYVSDNGTSGNEDCVIHNFSNGSYGECGIVFDAFGGAKRAYTVRTGFWNDGNNHGWAYLTGPTSALGMPITNEYGQGGSTARQDFQKGYLYCDGSSVTSPQTYPVCAAGWTSSGWNHQYSYLFADAYDRNGASKDVGNSCGNVQTLLSNILIQKYVGGNDTPDTDTGWIMYDQENWKCNDEATNEAYWVYGTIKDQYDDGLDGLSGPEIFGCATIDRFHFGKWCQDFKNGDQFFRIYGSGTPVYLPIDPCTDVGDYHTTGGLDTDGFADIACVYDYLTGLTRIHVFLSCRK